MEDKESYETHDIYLAAYLLLVGCKLDNEKRVGTRKYFTFSHPSESVNKLRREFYDGTARVSPSDYSQKIVAFKALVMGP